MQTDSELEKISSRILELIKKEGRPLTTESICRALGIPPAKASAALYLLLKSGSVKRLYTEVYDPTRPFDTASWYIQEESERAQTAEAPSYGLLRLVISIPLSMHDLRAKLLNDYQALEFHDAYMHIIELAENELKIMCPVIDAYALFPLISKLNTVPGVRLKILTEMSKSKDLEILERLAESRKLEVRSAEAYTQNRKKILGIHAKLMIADERVALVGSFNLSRYHYLIDFDIGFLIYDPSTVKKLSQLFDALWERASK